MARYRVDIMTPHGPQTFEAGEDQHVLDAALDAGLDLPYSCLQGWCLSCAVRLEGGAVDQQDSTRYFEEDRADGFALICTARPKSDLTLRSHARDEMRAARARHGLPYPRGDWGS
jgi:ferredoxin